MPSITQTIYPNDTFSLILNMVDLFEDNDVLTFQNIISTGIISILNPSVGVYEYTLQSPIQGSIL